MSKENLVVQDINVLNNQIKQVKNAISDMKARNQALSSQPVVSTGQGLRNSLNSILSANLAPQNVGQINKVAWQFFYTVDFDLTTTVDWPDLTSNTRQSASFQVSQEAAFLMMGIFRHANDYNDAGDLGPLTIEFRDRQSSRFFNDSPIPIQMLARDGYVSYLPVPMILLPNAFFELTMATHLAAGVTQATPAQATGKHTFTIMGYRVRVDDAKKVLSSIFG